MDVMPPVDPGDVDGRSLALALLDKRGGEDAIVVHGRGVHDGGALRFELPGGMSLEIPREAMGELRPVTDDDDREVLGDADYWISLTVGSGPGEVRPQELIDAGIHWPPPGEPG